MRAPIVLRHDVLHHLVVHLPIFCSCLSPLEKLDPRGDTGGVLPLVLLQLLRQPLHLRAVLQRGCLFGALLLCPPLFPAWLALVSREALLAARPWAGVPAWELPVALHVACWYGPCVALLPALHGPWVAVGALMLHERHTLDVGFGLAALALHIMASRAQERDLLSARLLILAASPLQLVAHRWTPVCHHVPAAMCCVRILTPMARSLAHVARRPAQHRLATSLSANRCLDGDMPSRAGAKMKTRVTWANEGEPSAQGVILLKPVYEERPLPRLCETAMVADEVQSATRARLCHTTSLLPTCVAQKAAQLASSDQRDNDKIVFAPLILVNRLHNHLTTDEVGQITQ
mmetsp:Transcript_73428/g.190699  ORF Transcript_73428/g.190699 Transcript_73428/m.190699 type:complete len:346 (+) Transcript_73428:1200-2237(+)